MTPAYRPDIPDGCGGTRPQKPATAARIYDYLIGGTHNFPADRAAAHAIIEQVPRVPAAARANRRFLGRAVRDLAACGIRQFLDVGSGIPTEGNVHEIAQAIAPDTRVVYVDIDPVAVAEGLELLEHNPIATAILGDLRDVSSMLCRRDVAGLLDFTQPIAVMLCAVLHFVDDDEAAYAAVAQLRDAVCPGSYLVLSHVTPHPTVAGTARKTDRDIQNAVQDTYARQTATPLRLRDQGGIARFFDGFDLIEPGLTWVNQWRPDPGEADEFADQPQLSASLAGVGRRTRDLAGPRTGHRAT